MKIKVWGSRGSFAVPGPSTLRYGGNTTCLESRRANRSYSSRTTSSGSTTKAGKPVSGMSSSAGGPICCSTMPKKPGRQQESDGKGSRRGDAVRARDRPERASGGYEERSSIP